MTAQIADTCIYNGKIYSIIGIRSSLFEPDDWGLKPKGGSTHCYRGYYAEYEIKDSAIYLQKLTVSHSGETPPINNIDPIRNENKHAVYNHINMKILFNGWLRLATDFIDDYYVHMGFQKASAFGVVFDLLFEDGKLSRVTDRSEEMREKRGSFKRSYDRGLPSAITQAFSLDMDLE